MYSKEDKKEIFSKPYTNIYLRRSDFPDMIIEYMPETTFISLVCNFGGLLGMWMGVSMLNSIIVVYKLAKVNFKKIINILIKYKYNFNVNIQNNINIKSQNRGLARRYTIIYPNGKIGHQHI